MINAILTSTRKEISARMKKKPLKMVMSEAARYQTRPFLGNIGEKNRPAIIAEIKNGKPKTGKFHSQLTLEQRITLYEAAGASAVSIVTEPHFFYGSIFMISKARTFTNLPILFKDFIIKQYQIHEAKAMGADAILFIARILSPEKLRCFVNLANKIHLEPIVEINNQMELSAALSTKSRCIAVNARNLDTMKINIQNACNLGKQIPADRLFLGFSGIRGKKDFKRYLKSGAKAVLIGSLLMKTDNPDLVIKQLMAKTYVKICGLRTESDTRLVIRNGIDFIGFLFVPGVSRSISFNKAEKLIKLTPPTVKTVGVFVNCDSSLVLKTAEKLNLDFVQLHGDESVEYCNLVGKYVGVIKAFRVNNAFLKNGFDTMAKCYMVDYFLIDRQSRAHKLLNWVLVEKIAMNYPIFLSGGLSPNNVSKAINAVSPFGVDVSSGVERNGVKDRSLIKSFIVNAKRA